MKYIKTYESLESESKLHALLCSFLKKIEKTSKFELKTTFYERGEKGTSEALSFNVFKNNRTWSDKSSPAFSIRVSPVGDKQLRDESVKPKIKVLINSCYYHPDEDTIPFLLKFIKETFRKYSYFMKDDPSYTFGPNASKTYFFINTSDINNIMGELNDNFEMWMNTQKYNL